jgi:hypothetical protein
MGPVWPNTGEIPGNSAPKSRKPCLEQGCFAGNDLVTFPDLP